MAGKITGQHWMYKWIDEFEITDLSRLSKVINLPEASNRLLELAEGASSGALAVSDVPSSGAVVAGLGLDLISPETCSDFGCRSKIADTEFASVLQYFDVAVMQGPLVSTYERDYVSLRKTDDAQEFFHLLHNDVRLLLHIRKSGLVNYIMFDSGRPCYCEEHRRQHALSLGMSDFIDEDRLAVLAKELSASGAIDVTQTGPREWSGSFREPSFTGTTAVTLNQKTRPKKQVVALKLLQGQLDEMVYDAAFAKQAGLPIASLVEPHMFARPSESAGLNVDDVALRVKIPAIRGLSTADFIRLREEEFESFLGLQVLIRQAIEETIRDNSGRSPEETADIVWQNKIHPQVIALRQKIAASERARDRKLAAGATFGAASFALGSIATAVAASGGLPLVTAVGAAAGVAGILPSMLRYREKRIEEEQQFQSEGAYFVWKAQTASTH
ncbi:hypothetical protein [Actinoplanes sp. RD1]|uniref:hypothetical protein n=1 Tax=Actinoplanes sp. RD1 TaxID=3064538 RepID=UPI002740D61B|nr:hypothetical protein [Actinoplanes sp. RD1]